jgi:phosphoglycerate kinase
MAFQTLDDMGDMRGKTVLVRCDLNVPMQCGAVSDDTRLRASVPTLAELSDRGAKVLVLSHFGRPKGADPACSLAPLAKPLADVLGRPVAFIPDCIGQTISLADGEIALLENTRFHPGEEANASNFIESLALQADAYVNDSFSTAHRAHASTEGLAHVLPSYAGRSMQAELEAIEKALEKPQKPVAAIIGGAKVSTKLEVLQHLVTRVDHLMIGGAMANTFLVVKGVNIGKSLAEPAMAETAQSILDAAAQAGCTVHLPYEVVVAKTLTQNAPHRLANVFEVAPDEMILDIGPAAVEALADALKTCATCIWNGPMGAFEIQPFDAGTVALARVAAGLTAAGQLISVAGGGDTVAALNHAGVADEFSYVSTAGGAFLEWMEGRVLPGVAALERA